jgi:two-component system sensor histidine kinase KdpD
MGVRVTRASRRAELVRDLAVAIAAPAAAVILAEIVHTGLSVSRFGLLFLAAVTVAASIRGSRAAVLTAIIGVAAYKLFLDLRTADHTTAVEDILNLAIFLVVALVTGTLAGRVHDEAAKARRHAENTEILYQTSRTLTESEDGNVWPALARAVAAGTGGACLAVDAGGSVQARASGSSSEDPLLHDEENALEAARRALQDAPGQRTVSVGRWRSRTIEDEQRTAGVLVWEFQESAEPSEEFIELVVELANASLARKRAREEQMNRKAAEEVGNLREALLSSISHDFRSPLAAIIGSATSLLEYGDKFNQSIRDDLLANIRDEGEKLNQFVANLLNMTRLQAGVIHPSKERVELAPLIKTITDRHALHRGKVQQVHVDTDCAVDADRLLLEQAIYNILDNASKYADTPQGLEVTCEVSGATACIRISDHGPGLAEEDHAGIFSTFHFDRKAGRSKGTGLGLSIARGFVEAMGGSIKAGNRSDGQPGLEITIGLPRSDS